MDSPDLEAKVHNNVIENVFASPECSCHTNVWINHNCTFGLFIALLHSLNIRFKSYYTIYKYIK